MDNKGKKVLEEAGLLYPTPNCVEYYQVVKATADEVVQRLYEAMSDFVQVVRCKDCKFADETAMCGHVEWYNKPDDFCSRGERREVD